MSINPIFNHFTINFKKNVSEYLEYIDYNNCMIYDNSHNKVHCFIKTMPLIDYVKYLIGKYKKYDIYKLPQKDMSCNNIYEKYINSIHNYSYVDNFFYILSSKLNKNNFEHAINVYDSFILMKENCKIDIVDDFEYLCDSNFFNENLNKLFHFEDKDIVSLFEHFKKPKISISDEEDKISLDKLDIILEDSLNEIFDLSFNINDHINYSKDTTKKVLEENIIDERSDNDSDEEEDSDEEDSEEDDSEEDDSEEDDSEEDDSDDEESDDEESDDEEIMEKLILIIKKMPTQNITLEKCENTLDYLFEEDKLNKEELRSALFQIIVTLYLYQNIFDFTHNDLHTNNIMYQTTEKTFLYYKIKGTTYKVPTFGKIYKLIDFGRSIYKYKETRICSDSFSSNGTATGQYNCEPFLNKNKPIIEPNLSFDLCRLGCSMFDYIVDDISNIDKFKKDPLHNMIIEWVYDDKNVNILYKKNGEERYPDFKLYKIIAKNVSKHIPEKQLDNICFNEYKCDIITEELINIDELIKTKVDL